MGRIARSWTLAQQSLNVLMKDKELILLPVLSTICIGLVLTGFAFGVSLLGFDAESADSRAARTLFGCLSFAFYVVSYTIGFFFQAALIAGALERMRGGNPTLGSALGAAFDRFGALLAWGVVAGTVGMLLNIIQEKSNLVGKIVAGLIGVAWTVATFFVVPVLVMERRPIGASLKQSTRIMKETWGESLSGSIGFGLLTVLLCLPFAALGLLLMNVSPVAAIIVAVLGVCTTGTFVSALQGVFVASLYRYAVHKDVPAGFDRADLQGIFA